MIRDKLHLCDTLVLTLTVLVTLSCALEIDDAVSQKSETKFNTYQNPSLDMKILYPSSWTQIIHPPFTFENPTPFFMVYFSPFSANEVVQPEFTIKVQNLSSSDETGNFNYEEIRRLEESYSDFKLIKSGTGPTIANSSSYNVEFTYNDEQGLTKTLMTWITKDGKAYTLSYSAKESEYDKYLPIFESMLSSFTVK